MDAPHPQQPPTGPLEGQVVGRVESTVGFTGPGAPQPHQLQQQAVPGPVWATLTPPPGAVAWSGIPAAHVAPRRRWLPAALAGAGIVLLLGGGAGGFAVGQATAGTGGATGGAGQVGQLVPGDGTGPGAGTDGGFGGFGGRRDGGTGGQDQSQLGQQGQLGQDGSGTGSDSGTGSGTGTTGSTTTT
ncbi:hypothetical protein [Kineococcus sp. NPDC059986]|uniref:hypothetical protein n=1 Tax=Kineococcus sp. NPDC059986 TaxID=3155538 RepID=UPI00344EC0BB